MAHVELHKLSGAIAILSHDERTEADSVKERKNECINPERTHLNYNLAPKRKGTLLEHISSVCAKESVILPKRKDLNVMASWVVTKPEGVTEEEEERFFAETYRFLQERYGTSHVLTAEVHLDETTPHLHYCFIPIGQNQKGQTTVSAKSVCNRKDLITFHKDLSRHMERVFGRDIGIINGTTANGNKSIEQLKKEKEQEQMEKRLANVHKMLCEAQEDLEALKGEKEYLQNEIDYLRACSEDLSNPKGAKELARLRKFAESPNIAPLYQQFKELLEQHRQKKNNRQER